MSTQIREATEADLGAVLGLYAQPGLDDGKVLDVEAARQVFAEIAHYPNYRIFVTCDALGHVLGSYALLIMHNLAHQGTPSAVVEDVVVHPEHHGEGFGSAMMKHAMRLAREAGCYKLALSSNIKRASAHAFYHSLGFRHHGLSFVVEI